MPKGMAIESKEPEVELRLKLARCIEGLLVYQRATCPRRVTFTVTESFVCAMSLASMVCAEPAGVPSGRRMVTARCTAEEVAPLFSTTTLAEIVTSDALLTLVRIM